MSSDARYRFVGGYPSSETISLAYDEADLNRAVHAYRFFYASVSGLAIFRGNQVLGIELQLRLGDACGRAETRRSDPELGHALCTLAARCQRWPAGRRAAPRASDLRRHGSQPAVDPRHGPARP